jgi:hypothetical protein
VNLPRLLLAFFPAVLPLSLSATQSQDILKAYEEARPADRDLGVFQLDWADSFTHAKVRAAREKRPIFLVCTTQLKDAGNLRDGHC